MMSPPQLPGKDHLEHCEAENQAMKNIPNAVTIDTKAKKTCTAINTATPT